VAVVLWISHYQDGWGAQVREWAPLAYILLGYWLPGRLVSRPSLALEWRLTAFDSRWLAGREVSFARRAPLAVIELLELAYLFCYPVLPIGLFLVRLCGTAGDLDRYWVAVMLSAALSYGALPWLPTRPPRAAIGNPPRRSRVRALNLFVLERASVQLNTFPSGHVATSVAAALAVTACWPAAGLALGFMALAITVASVVGRYHYAADAIAGVVTAFIAFSVSRG
jgi:hypothetical protein